MREKKSSAFFRVFSFFVLPPPKLQNYPLPLVLSFEPIFIVKCCSDSKLVLQLFFFVNFDFSCFFLYFLKRAISTLTQGKKSRILKIMREKLNAFENF